MGIRFQVNGQGCEVGEGERCTLVEHLRDGLHLKATRFGCGQERCGACVVLVDGEPRFSCQVEVANLRGRTVVTAEALGESVEGRELLAQFERWQAAQCGFCSTGILMRALHFLRTSTDGSRAAIAQALAAHLCRCGAQPRILSAIEAAWHATRGSR
jgi:nicotinate dehydrogenase subunit A